MMMLKILGFVFCLLVQLTLAVFMNLRIVQFYKKDIDVKQAFVPKDLNLAEALKQAENYNKILERG